MDIHFLQDTIEKLAFVNKGILAADESSPTIQKRFDTIALDSTEENRRNYRQLLFTTPDLSENISGVILFEETLNQTTQGGLPFAELLSEQGIVPGIKVDKGLRPFIPSAYGEKFTQGLDGLPERLEIYRNQGARFAKWRAVFEIAEHTPTMPLIKTNANSLGHYAAICQACNLVPIVEPEVLINGSHSLEKAEKISERVLHQVFKALYRHKVLLECILLKPSMITPGKDNTPASPEQVAKSTLKVFRRCVPAAVPSIHFLSGGQTPQEATENLNAMNQFSDSPWRLSFSYGRALQAPCLEAWQGKTQNIDVAQQALKKRAHLNALACAGKYKTSLES